MSYFLAPAPLSLGQQVDIAGEETVHLLLSRRVKVGDKIKIQGPDGQRFLAEITGARKNLVQLKILEPIAVPEEPRLKVTLFQAVLPEQPFDFILQKATELGVFKVVLFNTQNGAFELSSEKFLSKKPRWEKILWEAAKQSERGQIPQLEFFVSLEQVIGNAKALNQVWLLDKGGNQPAWDKAQNLGVLVGPEGGLTTQEIEQINRGLRPRLVKLSDFILRAETAAIAAASIALI